MSSQRRRTKRFQLLSGSARPLLDAPDHPVHVAVRLIGPAEPDVGPKGDMDRMIGFLSQLTHCIAVSLMCCNSTPDLEKYTGDSFRDLTRIARINDEMWSELFLDNKKVLLAEMERFRSSFDELYEKIQTGDLEGMREMMRLSTERRKLFDKTV